MGKFHFLKLRFEGTYYICVLGTTSEFPFGKNHIILELACITFNSFLTICIMIILRKEFSIMI